MSVTVINRTYERGTLYRLHDSGEVTYTHNHNTSYEKAENRYDHDVRYFHYDIDDNNDLDLVEIDLDTFKAILCESDYDVDFDRHTVFANGCAQICYTIRDI